jgi:hypothetical protein
MSDQHSRAEIDPEGLEDAPRYVDNPVSVLDATRTAGEAHGLSPQASPLYAHLLNLAHRLDHPFLQDKDFSSLSNEFRQIVKACGLDKANETGKTAKVSVLSDLQSKIQRPTRPA